MPCNIVPAGLAKMSAGVFFGQKGNIFGHTGNLPAALSLKEMRFYPC
jgi:hypothetical protein